MLPVGRDGLIDEDALDALLARGPALVAIQAVNNETGILQPLDRLAPKNPRRRVAAARRLRAKRGQGAAARCRLHRAVGAQVGRAARGRRAAGARPCHARPGRRAGEGLSPRDAGCARRAGLCRGARPRGPTTWRGWQSLRARLDDGVRAAGGVVIGEECAAPGDDRRGRAARRVERVAARPVRPRRDRRVGGQRLLVGQDEGQRGARRDAGRARCRGGVPARQLRAGDERGRGRRASSTSGGGSPSGCGRAA